MGNIVTVYIYVLSSSVDNTTHHYIVVKRIDADGEEYWSGYEWTSHGMKTFDGKKSARFQTAVARECLCLGNFSFEQVEAAVERASVGKSYNWASYNCNEWTRAVTEVLRKPISVFYNCSRALDASIGRNCHFGSETHHENLSLNKTVSTYSWIKTANTDFELPVPTTLRQPFIPPRLMSHLEGVDACGRVSEPINPNNAMQLVSSFQVVL